MENLPIDAKSLPSRIFYSEEEDKIYVGEPGDYKEIGATEDFISITKSQLDILIANNELIPNALYEITGVNPDLYGGTTIYLQAISTNELNPSGVGKFYNPKYDKNVDGFGIVKDYVWWTALGNQKESGVYAINDVVIWGGKHWTCIQPTTIATKYIIDDFELDTDYFEVVPFNDTDYNVAYDEIVYDYQNDWIIERNEANSNIVSFSYDSLVYLSNYWLLGDIIYDNPIRGFQWGNIFDYDSYTGIGFQRITNSLNRNVNFRGSYQYNLIFDNSSHQYNLTFDNGSSQFNLTFDNESYQYKLAFDNGSYQYNLAFNNYSYQYDLTFDNYSSQSYLTLDNDSRQNNLTFNNQSQQNYLTFNNSSQNNLTFDKSIQSNLTFDKYSYQSNLTFDNISNQSNLTFNNSNQTYLTFDDSRQDNLTFNDSSQDNLTLTNKKYQRYVNFRNYIVNYSNSSYTYLFNYFFTENNYLKGVSINIESLVYSENIVSNTSSSVTTNSETINVDFLLYNNIETTKNQILLYSQRSATGATTGTIYLNDVNVGTFSLEEYITGQTINLPTPVTLRGFNKIRIEFSGGSGGTTTISSLGFNSSAETQYGEVDYKHAEFVGGVLSREEPTHLVARAGNKEITVPYSVGASTSDDVSNESNVTGATVTDALNNLDTDKLDKAPNGTDNLIDVDNKLNPVYLPPNIMHLQGEWNAATNTPTLSNGTGIAGYIYEVTTAGTTDFGDGDIEFALGDWVVYGGDDKWYKSPNTGEVVGVKGDNEVAYRKGLVNLDIDDVIEPTANQFLVGNSAGTEWEKRGLVAADFNIGQISGRRVPVINPISGIWANYSVNQLPGNLSVALRMEDGRLKANDAIESNDLVPLGQLEGMLGDYVTLTGAQTIAGVKTFSSIPVLPATEPTTANQAVRKGYVDTRLDIKANDADVVKLTGNQTVAGVKTFSSSPIVPTATAITQAVNKGQMDTALTAYVNADAGNTTGGSFSLDKVVLRNPNTGRTTTITKPNTDSADSNITIPGFGGGTKVMPISVNGVSAGPSGDINLPTSPYLILAQSNFGSGISSMHLDLDISENYQVIDLTIIIPDAVDDEYRIFFNNEFSSVYATSLKDLTYVATNDASEGILISKGITESGDLVFKGIIHTRTNYNKVLVGSTNYIDYDSPEFKNFSVSGSYPVTGTTISRVTLRNGTGTVLPTGVIMTATKIN